MSQAQSGLFVPATIRGERAHLLVDTGATSTFLSSALIYRFEPRRRLQLIDFGTKIRSADGTPLETIGSAWVEIQVGATTQPVLATFGQLDTLEGILGMDFLMPTKGVLNFQTMEFVVGGERVRCTGAGGHAFCARVVIDRTTRIPPGHEALIPGHIVRDEPL